MHTIRYAVVHAEGNYYRLTLEDVNQFICQSVDKLNKLGYNHDDRGALPIREDSASYVKNYLCAPKTHAFEPVVRAGKRKPPTVTLLGDGTIELTWVHNLRCLKLRVPCRGVCLYTKTYDDGQTRIDGMLASYKPGGTIAEMDGLLAWVTEKSQ